MQAVLCMLRKRNVERKRNAFSRGESLCCDEWHKGGKKGFAFTSVSITPLVHRAFNDTAPY